MTVAVAPLPWMRAAASGHGAQHTWRWAQVVSADDGVRMQWHLTRNCSLSPRHMLCMYAALCVVSLCIALAFAWVGAAPVLMFAGVELLLVGAAFLVYARHAGDAEHIELAQGRLTVLVYRGTRVERTSFRATSLRVDLSRDDTGLVTFSGDGDKAVVGRHLRREWRGLLAQEVRHALRTQSITSDLS